MSSRSIVSAPFATRLWQLVLLLLCILLYAPHIAGSPSNPGDLTTKRLDENQHVFSKAMPNVHDDDTDAQPNLMAHSNKPHKHIDTLPALMMALDVMQEEYFEVWQGIWPTGIDWTSAVLETQISAALSTLSTSFAYTATTESNLSPAEKAHENMINRYFSQLVASYFGQDHFRLRNEAYDDMLWVVLGWLESIKFIELHSDLHYKDPQWPIERDSSKQHSWYGKQWIPSFAHRARIFWDLASKGWNTSLCDGGMIWSPYLAPYKNAITNELFITASISMYLYFPGDDNPAPYMADTGPPIGPRDPRYLAAAIEAYKWLYLSNMRNEQGLFVDGFHVSGWERHPINGSKQNTKCDSRNNQVYTYNQGVLLSGQRGLWEVTGAKSYLEEGHELISNVIDATGWDLKHDRLYPDLRNKTNPHLGQWHGIGRSGVLEEDCDRLGYCSQDAQTFKGIFFHHLALFCVPLPPHYLLPGENLDIREFQALKTWHYESCARYGRWIRQNAEAAIATRNEDGKYGMWWGAPSGGNYSWVADPESKVPKKAVDYRNRGIPKDRTWQDRNPNKGSQHHLVADDGQHVTSPLAMRAATQGDANDRGRGRTVETQAGGLAVLRALWEIVDTHQGRGMM
jgi:hypothetical protein